MKLPADYRIIVICQAGEKIGLGHLSRALVVLNALSEHGYNPELLVHGPPISLKGTGSIPVQFTNTFDLATTIRAAATDKQPNLVIFDLQPQCIPSDIENLLSLLKARNCKIITIDAMANMRHLVDLVFIPAFQLKEELNQGDTSKLIYGWDCFLLKVADKRTHWQNGGNLLVLTGGSDATNLGNSWPTELDAELPTSTILHWVTGPYAQPPQWPKNPRLSSFNYQAPDNLHQLMSTTNYAVTVYGISFYELLYYGVPTVVFSPYGDKDDTELASIEKSGIALVAKDEKEAIVKIKQLMASPSIASSISAKAKHMMTQKGDNKLIGLITKLLGKQ